jgi:hypothetical protein
MTQPNLLELAKQGDAKAIASVINHLLKDEGITAKAIQKDDTLLVILESAQAPEQTSSVEFIHKLMMKLGIESIEYVTVYGKQAGQPSSAWMKTLNLTAKVEEPKKQTSSSESLWRSTLKAIADRWPFWFPYPSSWLRALSLAVPTYAGVTILSLEVWRSLCWLILAAATKSSEPYFFMLLTGAWLVASLIVYLVMVVLYSFLLRLVWKNAPGKTGWGLHPKNWWNIFYGFVVTTLATLVSFLPFLSSIDFPRDLVLVTIQKYARDDWQVITTLFSFWFVPAVYLYQAEYLTRQRLIPKLNAVLRNSQFLRNASRWKSQKLAKKLLIILLIPLVAVGVYLFSKLPELKETTPVPIASQAPSVTPTPITPASPATSSLQRDFFGEAVNKAMSAATITQSAKSKDDWNLVVSQWQEAITLMEAVPSSHPRYPVAQQKSIEYKRNLDYALKNVAAGQ